MKKSIRQSRIEQLINQYPIGTQEDLMRHLKEIGIKATQATISRDIREMQVVKAQDGHGHLRYTIFKPGNKSEEEHLRETINEVVIGLTRIEFINVIKTLPSNGNLLAAILDDLKLPEVVGTLAGHDTILVISPNADVAQQLNDEIAENMNPDIVH
ncbi:arginine repressor [Secundilactobacillus similis]|jgi:transcriptional regulator of arginine metabolism|uniref:Arginine repressor n=1 Tax=Secundilactobacillus similis DSM 23365 = JCM 2765 TaxID=1423804 RepID=A0A0R2EMW0_9LACO|nr:arginine repressor [Secundilactobacillus similis]KRN17759.1 arginine repressor [Secundilactobacillus similis DSM 23365 = JCM 2765]